MSTIKFGSTVSADRYVDGWLVPEDEVRALIFCPSWHAMGRVTDDDLFLGHAPVSLSSGDDMPVQADCRRRDCPTPAFYLIAMSRLRQAMKSRRLGKLRINVTTIGEELPLLRLND